jgi:DNA polymerase III epsilon subunit-like protein
MELDKSNTAVEQDDDIMIDLETLGLKQDAAIIAIGAVRFNIETGEIGDRFHQNILWESALKYGASSPSTVTWWGNQSQAAKDALLSPAQLPIEDVMNSFREWLGPDPIVWGNGAVFDIAKLEHYFDMKEEMHPWFYRNTRDVRTIDMLGRRIFKRGISDQTFEGIKHHPVDDAVNTARYVHDTYNIIRLASMIEH